MCLIAASSRTQTKESLQQLAVGAINEAARINQTSILTLLTTGIQRLATAGNDKTVTDQILRLFEEVLKTNPNNVIALIGKARVHYGRNQFSIALRLYQKALMARPDMQPDPRIGIGQCFWHLKMKSDALAAWERAAELVALCPHLSNMVETKQHLRKRPFGNVLSRRSIPRSRHKNLH